MSDDWPTTCEDCGAEFNLDYVSFPPEKVNPSDYSFTPSYCPFCGGEL